MATLTAFIAGLTFGFGLILSGMANPKKILDFLDVTGQWDPSLLFVMMGALAVSFFSFRYARTVETSYLQQKIQLPTATHLDKRLVLGSVAFGLGWGIAGYCPGPALTSLLTGQIEPVIFVLAMLSGMGLFALLENKFKWN